MKKTKLNFIIGLMVVCLISIFLWLGKTPYIFIEKGDPHLSSLQMKQPVVPEPDENPDEENIQIEMETTGSEHIELPDDLMETETLHPETLSDILSMTTGPLELPVEGATGWAAIAVSLHSEADAESSIITDFEAGQVFVIKSEQGNWWYVETNGGVTGWVEHIGCFINLPDVIPSIVYNITNAYSALTRSSGHEIPGVTGQVLYEAMAYNPRLSRDEFIVPTLYSTSKLLFKAQHLALEAGDTIILHEAYRAHVSQQRSVNLLKELMDTNEEVRSAIEDGPWSLNWFIATSLSNHQRGVAFDVSLGKVLSYEIVQFNELFYARVVEHEEYPMPTVIHELSPMAIALVEPVSSRSPDAWREVPLADTMTPGSKLLLNYFDKAGFTPLASEWWHFNDLEGVLIATELDIRGCFFINVDELQSRIP